MSTIKLIDVSGQVSQNIKITIDDLGVRAALSALLNEADELSVIARIKSYTQEATDEAFIDSITLGLDDGTGSVAYYTRFVGHLTQSGNAAPVAVEFENDIGTITWSRVSTGVYRGTAAAGTFTEDKTYITKVLESSSTDSIEVLTAWISATVLEITAKQSGAVADGLLTDTPIEIRVYS